jgi:hypothetical protein
MTDQVKIKLSNFRRSATIEVWPLGGGKRGRCVFQHEANKRGQRILRTTTGAPKATTYYQRIALADGDDGRIHIVGFSEYGMLCVMASDMRHGEFTLYPKDDLFETYRQQLFAVTEI